MKPQPSYQKLRGGYYTPAAIARFLCAWAIQRPRDRVLEPSCGDGVFLDAAAARLLDLGAAKAAIGKSIIGFEIDVFEAAKAAARLEAHGVSRRNARIYAQDFFSEKAQSAEAGSIDAVVGNPPFVRYQNFPEQQRSRAFAMMQRAGLRPNRLTNAWVPFVVGAALRLTDRGRLAMVIPAELLQVSYAAELRLFLTEFFAEIVVVTFRRLAFDGIQQEVVLLLARRGASGHQGIDVLELESAADLADLDVDSLERNDLKTVDHSSDKWTKYFLSQKEIDLLSTLHQHPALSRLGDLGDADIGIVTGMNDVFVLKEAEAARRGLSRLVRPIVSRSGHLRGIVFNRQDWRANAQAGFPVHLLDLPPRPKDKLARSARKYLTEAESRGLNRGYKCRIRKLWHVVPSVYAPDAFLLRQIHGYPKLVVNEADATCTDTIHRVRFKEGTGANPHLLAAAFLNSLTFAFAEVLGRSYGGGVLELEPSEADRLPIPLAGSEHLDAAKIDSLVREGRIHEVLRLTDDALLRRGLGLPLREARMLNEVWQKLQARRIGRRGRDARHCAEAEAPHRFAAAGLSPSEARCPGRGDVGKISGARAVTNTVHASVAVTSSVSRYSVTSLSLPPERRNTKQYLLL